MAEEKNLLQELVEEGLGEKIPPVTPDPTKTDPTPDPTKGDPTPDPIETDPTPDPKKVEVEVKPDPEKEVHEDEKPNPMRELRNNYEQAKRDKAEKEAILKQIADAHGMTIEEYLADLQKKKDSAEAQKRGVPVEVQEEIRRLREETESLRKVNIQREFGSRIEKLRQTESLNREQLESFFKKADEMNVDLVNSPIDLVTMYRAFNLSTILDKVKAETKQAVLAEIAQKQQKAPEVNPENKNPSKTPESEADIIASILGAITPKK